MKRHIPIRLLPGQFISIAIASAVLAGIAMDHTAAESDDQSVWLFTSFRGDGDGLHLAYSTDARNWTDLGRVFLKPEVGSKLMRDPHIVRGPDELFHMVWTSGWSDQGIGYANSTDLVNWSEQRYLPLMENRPGTKTCWAPEVYYETSDWKSWTDVTRDTAVVPGQRHGSFLTITRPEMRQLEPNLDRTPPPPV